MNLKKIIYTIIILIISLVLFSSCEDTPTQTEEPTIPATLTKIECVNYTNEVCYVGIEYIPSQSLQVIARYSDNSKKDVTGMSSFTADTSKIGTTLVTVSYLDKTFTFSLYVIELELSYITVEPEESTVKYKTGDTFNSNDLIVYGHYANGTIKRLKEFSYYFEKNGVKKITFSTPGIYTAYILYKFGDKVYETSYTLEVTGQPLSYSFQYIELDTSKVKKNFNKNDNFNFNNLRVMGMLNYLDGELIDSNSYEVTLTRNGQVVDRFTNGGEYTVNVLYKGDIECATKLASYNIYYKSTDENLINISFEYSISTFSGYSVEVDKTVEFDLLSHIIIPEGYAFIGINKIDFSNLKDGTVIKINLALPATGKYIVAFLNNDYTLFSQREFIKNTEIKFPSEKPIYVGEQANFVKWNCDNLVQISSCIVLPEFELIVQNVKPQITFESTGSLSLEIPNSLKEIKEVNIKIYDEDNKVYQVHTKINPYITGLKYNHNYTISGYVIGVGQTGEVKLEIKDQKINLSWAAKVPVIDVINTYFISHNQITIDTYSYKYGNQDFTLDSFIIKDSNGKIVSIKKVYEENSSIIFTDLKPSTQYYVHAMYKNSDGDYFIEVGNSFETLIENE